jgi:hypothetical protein
MYTLHCTQAQRYPSRASCHQSLNKDAGIISPRGEASRAHWSGNLQACLYHNVTVIKTRDEPYLLESALVSRQTCR